MVPDAHRQGARPAGHHILRRDAGHIQLVFLENIDELYVDYDRTTPQEKIDYTVTEGDNSVSYYLETTYNYEFTVTTEQGSDFFQIINRRDVKYD